MTVKQKSLSLAVLSALASVGASAQSSIAVNNDGTGSYLAYPFYTVNGNNDTLVSVVNSTASVKAIKVRFFDGKNTKEVLDFNLFLSPYDVWTAAVTIDSATGGGVLKTTDKSCTVPAIPATGVAFRNFTFTERDADGNTIDNSLVRTSEGHLEMIEMGVVTHGTVAKGVTHVAGVPANCGAAVAMYLDSNVIDDAYSTALTTPTGGLFGTGTLINVPGGMDASYDATALNSLYSSPQHGGPGAVVPSINSAATNTASSFFHTDGNVYTGSYGAVSNGSAAGVNAVSALFMRSTLMNEWITDAAIGAGTDWVVTFPTKVYYMNACGIKAANPFTAAKSFCANGAPESISISAWDQEERTVTTKLDFSPLPPGGVTALPWEVNTVTFNNSNVLGSKNKFNLNTPSGIGAAGWARFDLVGAFATPDRVLSTVVGGGLRNFASCNGPAPAAASTLSQRGLPVMGFAVQKYVNGSVGGVLSNYAGNYSHKYQRTVSCS